MEEYLAALSLDGAAWTTWRGKEVGIRRGPFSFAIG